MLNDNQIKHLEEESKRSAEASQILNNPLFQEALNGIYDQLEAKALTTPTTDHETCADIIRCKQLMKSFERIFTNYIDTGKMANMELERSRKKPK